MKVAGSAARANSNPTMQVVVLQILSENRFVGRVVSSNAALEFVSSNRFDLSVARGRQALLLLDNCRASDGVVTCTLPATWACAPQVRPDYASLVADPSCV